MLIVRRTLVTSEDWAIQVFRRRLAILVLLWKVTQRTNHFLTKGCKDRKRERNPPWELGDSTNEDWCELWERRESRRCNVIAIFLGQVNTNNLYNLVSKHEACSTAAWSSLTSYCKFISFRAKQASPPPGLDTETGPRKRKYSKLLESRKHFFTF